MEIELCNKNLLRVSIHVTAEIIDGKLLISGQDIGKACEEAFGESDYEYFYNFDIKNTEKLFNIITKETACNKLNALHKYFQGIDGCKILRKFCQEHDIIYSFY